MTIPDVTWSSGCGLTAGGLYASDQRFASRARTYQGHVALLTGDVEGAGNLFRRSLGSSIEMNDEDGMAAALEGSAAVWAANGSMESVALLLGAGTRAREQVRSKTLPFERPLIDAWLDEASATLSEDAWTSLLEQGGAMDPNDALVLLGPK
jgi:hypothetical protein